MSNIFDSVDFENKNEPEAEVPKHIEFNSNTSVIEVLVNLYREELDKFFSGKSKFNRKPIHLDKGTSPVKHALSIFEHDPTEKSLQVFLICLRQDCGQLLYDYLKEQTAYIFKTGKVHELPTEQPLAMDIAHKVAELVVDIIRVTNKSTAPNEIEKARFLGEALAREIDNITLSRCRELQNATKKAFEIVEKKLARLEQDTAHTKIIGPGPKIGGI